MVYGLFDEADGVIVYVGKTKNARKRFEAYRYGTCHNPLLHRWLREVGGRVRVRVLERDPEDINAVERAWIKRLRPTLLNLTGGGEQAWRQHESRPWMFGALKCPSDILINRLHNRGQWRPLIEQVKEARRGMSANRRTLFEVSLCMDFWDMCRKPFEAWLNGTQERLMKALRTGT